MFEMSDEARKVLMALGWTPPAKEVQFFEMDCDPSSHDPLGQHKRIITPAYVLMLEKMIRDAKCALMSKGG